LADQRVLVLGAGGVGNAIARRLRSFEAGVTRVGRSAREDELGHVHPMREVPRLLAHHDLVMAALPLTQETRHVVDSAFLGGLPDGGLLVNVGRGALVDTNALVKEVRAGRRMAALDVTDPEPPPPEHPLFRAPGVVVTPHIGGISTAALVRARHLVREQIERLATGRPFRNVVP
jgi:phosphoglycerate dehydrogenase-like enzyme